MPRGANGRYAISTAAIAAVAALAVHAPPAAAATRYVSTARQFQRAVTALRSSGGTIEIRPGSYARTLTVGARSSRLLVIRGSGGTHIQSLLLDHTRDVTVRDLTVRPLAANGGLLARYSSHIVVRGVTFTAFNTANVVTLNLDHSDNVVVRNSDFSHCGDNTPQWSFCLLPRWASHVTVKRNSFHDCLGCDFIHGRAGPSFNITGNSFARALRCTQTWFKCGHQDLIEMFAADGLTVRRNLFGVSELGGAQLYMALAVDHVRVMDNLFIRSDPAAPGVISRVGILVGTKRSPRVPRDVEIVNNTVLSGDLRPDHAAESIVLSPHYGGMASWNRPLVANNVVALQLAPNLTCGRSRSYANVVASGTACGSTDAVGDPQLDADGHPTAGSSLVIDQADPRYAPPLDLLGHPRVGPPDIGCYEYDIGA